MATATLIDVDRLWGEISEHGKTTYSYVYESVNNEISNALFRLAKDEGVQIQTIADTSWNPSNEVKIYVYLVDQTKDWLGQAKEIFPWYPVKRTLPRGI